MAKTTPTRLEGLVVRKHADKSTGERVVRFDPVTGEKKLVNPATPGDDHEPWPLAGITLEVAPERTTVTTQLVAQGISEGWLTAEGQRPVVRPAGPTQDILASSHTGQPHLFVHADRLVFHTLTGDVAYRVVHQPDKYADHDQATWPDQVDAFAGDDDTPVTPEIYAAGATRVDHFYGLVKES